MKKYFTNMLEELLEEVFIPLDVTSIKRKLLEYPVRTLGDHLGITEGRLWKRCDDGSYELVKQTNGDGLIGYKIPEDYNPIQTIIRDGYIFSRQGDEGRNEKIEGEIGVRDFVAVPIGKDVSYIVSFDTDGDPAKIRRQGRFLKTISALAYRVLSEAERIREIEVERGQIQAELELAYEIQNGILPPEQPKFHDYDIFGLSKPVKKKVGGDHYDFILLDDENLGFEIADAAGKGITAARYVRDLHIALRMGIKYGSKIDRIIQNLNSVIYENVNQADQHGRFVTLFYGELNKNGSINYVNAGHDRPLLLRNSDFIELDKGGLLLGVDPDAKYELGVASLNEGDILTLYTDGVTETPNRDFEFFGVDRLKEVIHNNREEPAKDISKSIFDAMKKHRSGHRKTDDRTLVIIKK